MFYHHTVSTLGPVWMVQSQEKLLYLGFGDLLEDIQHRFPQAQANTTLAWPDVEAALRDPSQARSWPMQWQGTAFQHRVWRALQEIPPGHTWSYGQMAQHLGMPTSARAVARACGANTIALGIPCHRVVGSNGHLTGYRWGIERKANILEHERAGVFKG